ncbi:MAG: hypothetical protein ABI823_02425 [Bryobacteraceae bacterium]
MLVSPDPRGRAVTASLRLKNAYGFDQSALEENRQGRLAWKQTYHLVDRLGPPIGAALLAGFIWGFMWLVYAWMIRKTPLLDAISEVIARLIHPSLLLKSLDAVQQVDKLPLVYSGAAVSLVLLVIGSIFAMPHKFIRDLLNGTVRMVLGRVILHSGEKLKRGQPDGRVRYYLRLPNDEVFEVSREGHDAIDEGGVYAVYYLPRSRVVVAVDPRMDVGRVPVPLSERPSTGYPLRSPDDPPRVRPTTMSEKR